MQLAFDSVGHFGAVYFLSDGSFHGRQQVLPDNPTIVNPLFPLIKRAVDGGTTEGFPTLGCLSVCTDRKGNTILSEIAQAGGGSFQYYLANLGRGQLDYSTFDHIGPFPFGGDPDVELLLAQINHVSLKPSMSRLFIVSSPIFAHAIAVGVSYRYLIYTCPEPRVFGGLRKT